jgi:hypothetical protein
MDVATGDDVDAADFVLQGNEDDALVGSGSWRMVTMPQD